MSPDNLPADPQNPVITTRAEAAMAFGEWFATASDDDRQAFVNGHGDLMQQRRERTKLSGSG